MFECGEIPLLLHLHFSDCRALVYIPDAFTPDGNQVNDTFYPVFAGQTELLEYKFTVFDRWGSNVFYSTAPGHGWDGTFGSRSLPPGLYVWQLQFATDGSDTTIQAGTVRLIR